LGNHEPITDTAVVAIISECAGIGVGGVINYVLAATKRRWDKDDLRTKELGVYDREVAHEGRAACKNFLLAMRGLHDELGLQDLSTLSQTMTPKEQILELRRISPESEQLMVASLDAETEVDVSASPKLREAAKVFKADVFQSLVALSQGRTGDYAAREDVFLQAIAEERRAERNSILAPPSDPPAVENT
jgi:hypothetical protein